MLKNTSSQYGLITKIFHWLLAPALIGLLLEGFIMTSLPFRLELYYWHKSIGVTILCLVVLRFLWKMINITLNPPSSIPYWQVLASKFTHLILYLCMLVMPFTGLFMSRFGGYPINVFNLFTIEPYEKNLELARLFNKIHTTTAFIFCGLITLHILAALYHHFILKDNLLARITK